MDQIICNFKSVVINKKGSPHPEVYNNLSENISQENKSMVDRGFYNGDILGCTVCKQIGDTILLECHRFKFFDLVFNRIKRDYFPSMVNVNAVISIKDKNQEDYILFIKRGKDVYAYEDYWDFPAGLVPFDEPLIGRLKDRIEKDLNIKENNFAIPEQPSFIISRDIFFGLYYDIQCSLKKSEIESILNQKIKNGEILLVKKSQISEFLSKYEKVYPIFLNDVF